MLANNTNHQPLLHNSPPIQTQSSYRFVPPRKRFNLPKVPIMAQISGLLSLLLIGAGLITANQLTQTSQNLQSQAATGNVFLEFEPKAGTLEFNQEKTFFVVATPTTGMSVTAAVLRFRTMTPDLFEVTGVTTTQYPLPVVLKQLGLEANGPALKQWAITLGANPNQPMTSAKNLVAVKIKANNKAGRGSLEIAANSEIAAFNNAGNVNKKAQNAAEAQAAFVVLDIKAPTVPATPVPPKPTPTPSTTASPTPTPTTTVTPSPSVSPSPSPSGTPSATAPQLNLSFKIQNVAKEGISIPTEVSLRYQHKTTNQKVVKTYNRSFISTQNGVMTSADFFLPDLQLAEVGGPIEIFVKTPTTLRKKLGTVTVQNTSPRPTLTASFGTDALKLTVGDFDRSTDQENKFRLTDVSKMLNQYKRVSNPVNDQNREFDTNYDGTFNLVDLSLIVDNYRQILLVGETP